ncbi:cytochrome b [Psychrobacter sp. S1-30-MNA-CIBAN-0213]|uniref:cytochrome b n=1 Tax=unclassified Psychrobacter TaxID=196806 RepID=UPI0033168D3A
MSLKNTSYNYGTIAKCLHWGTALLFLGAYASVYFRHWFTVDDTPINWTALQLHLSFGVSIAVLVVLRIIWRMMNRTPDEEPGTKMEHLAAHAGHFALYAVLIIMPVTGYLGSKVNTEFYFLFDIPMFESTSLFRSVIRDGMGISYEAFEAPLDFLHKQVFGKWLAWMLVVGHILAALYHHYVKKDRTLIKMTTGGEG